MSDKLAFGCSHTYGIGVETIEAWPYLLGAINFGVPGVSSDYIARILPEKLVEHNPKIVYVLWPDWRRFEYFKNGKIRQSLPSDTNRINFMETATDEWLHKNFVAQVTKVRELCKDIKLIELTLYDLIPFIDHSDRWPLSKLGHHYNEEWHRWVADIFENKAEWIVNHRHFA
jgi:hypothetical protein